MESCTNREREREKQPSLAPKPVIIDKTKDIDQNIENKNYYENLHES